MKTAGDMAARTKQQQNRTDALTPRKSTTIIATIFVIAVQVVRRSVQMIFNDGDQQSERCWVVG